jgi:glycosyltransferase involved in cell wall biosynthesis
MRELVINGRFLSQRATGVQRVAGEFTRALDRLLDEGLFPSLRVRLVAQEDADPAPLRLRHIRFETAPGGGGHLWEQRILPRHVRGGTLLCLGNSAPVLSLLGPDPVGVMLHDQAHLLFPGDYSFGYRLFHRVTEALILRRANPLFLVSEAERDAMEQREPGKLGYAVVAPNGSWIDDAPVALPSAAGRMSAPRGYGLFIGSLNERKNIKGVLATAIRLARERGHRFRFAGPPPTEAWIAEHVPAELRSLIQFTGYVADEELPTLYANAAYLLYPSFYEASGLPPSEAMTFGCPVVVSDLPVMRERCGTAALYCDPYDVSSIHAAVVQLLDQPEQGVTLSRNGLERARRFSWRRQALTIVEALEQVTHARFTPMPSPLVDVALP